MYSLVVHSYMFIYDSLSIISVHVISSALSTACTWVWFSLVTGKSAAECMSINQPHDDMISSAVTTSHC